VVLRSRHLVGETNLTSQRLYLEVSFPGDFFTGTFAVTPSHLVVLDSYGVPLLCGDDLSVNPSRAPSLLGVGQGKSVRRQRALTVPRSFGDKVVTKVAAGPRHTLAASVLGEVWAWGWGASGQLGTGGTSDCSKPAFSILRLASGVAALACGANLTLL
jgi:alpha-tubulin suppressor-like RCC1 family protein